jgi:opacity protein-like surface antigen
MRRTLLALFIAVPFVCGSATAQERPGAGRFEIGVFPVGLVVFTETSPDIEPAFGDFALGGSIIYNVNRRIGIEGEFGNAVGVRQNLTRNAGELADTQSPSLYTYSGNLIVDPFTRNRPVTPYATVGVGGLTLRDSNGVAPLRRGGNTTYFAGNAGGGLRWYLNDRLGLRGDYRLLVVRGTGDTPDVFGRDRTRFGHRVYGGLLFTY